jgi:hypothetical protein
MIKRLVDAVWATLIFACILLLTRILLSYAPLPVAFDVWDVVCVSMALWVGVLIGAIIWR